MNPANPEQAALRGHITTIGGLASEVARRLTDRLIVNGLETGEPVGERETLIAADVARHAATITMLTLAEAGLLVVPVERLQRHD